jgi:hypothetical protein
MATPLCIDTKHGNEQATFGLDLCLRDHRGQSGEQVKQIPNFYKFLSRFFFYRNSSLVGGKIFDQKVANYVSTFLDETNAHLLFYLSVTVCILKSLLSIRLNFFVIGMRGNQHFVYDPQTYHILHVATSLCMDCDLESKIIFMEQCDKTSKTQQWSFFSYNETLILKDLKQFFR